MRIPTRPLHPAPTPQAVGAGPLADTHSAAGALQATGLQQWRAELLQGLLRFALWLTLIPAVLTLRRLVVYGEDWQRPAVSWLAVIALAAMVKHRQMDHRLRTGLALAVLYTVGMWLLVRVSAAGPLFLLACPTMAALLVGPRAAGAILALCTASLTGAGWGLVLPLPTVTGVGASVMVKWLNFGANFGMLGLLLIHSCSFVLKRLERSLQDQQTAAASLAASEEALRQIAAQVPGMVYRVRIDHQAVPHFLYASPGSVDLLGLPPEALVADGRRMARCVLKEDRADMVRNLQQVGRTGGNMSAQFRVIGPDGQARWVQASSNQISHGPDGALHTGILVDITDRKRAEEQVWRQAHLDNLTGLPNRLLLQDRVQQAIADSRRSGRPLALMMLDLDQFKEVNDTLGHAQGDLLLQQAAQRLRQCVREGDTVARMGGDEFTVLLPTLDEADTPLAVGQRILQAMAEVFTLGGERAYVSASVGVARFPDDANDMDSLLKHADQALYLAKADGRNRLRWFTQALQEQAQLRMQLARDLRGALAAGQFELLYQPIVQLADGRCRKAEALLRWHHPQRGPVSPALFVPIAESTGLICELGEWVFQQAAAQVAQWRVDLDPRFQIAVNSSPLQFRRDACPSLPWPEQLAAMGLPGQAIAVEITEGLLLDQSEEVLAQLRTLREAGMALSLDDFGTGYSALAYLHAFKLDVLKIDRSFVSGMAQGDTSRKLCRAMVLMAHELGMQVVAEGVETEAQRDWLQQAGCDMAQGWHYGRPMNAAQFAQWWHGLGQTAPTTPAERASAARPEHAPPGPPQPRPTVAPAALLP